MTPIARAIIPMLVGAVITATGLGVHHARTSKAVQSDVVQTAAVNDAGFMLTVERMTTYCDVPTQVRDALLSRLQTQQHDVLIPISGTPARHARIFRVVDPATWAPHDFIVWPNGYTEVVLCTLRPARSA